MSDPSAAVERFYAGLAELSPRDWVSTILPHDPEEYEAASDSGREAIKEFAESPSDPEAMSALALVQGSATEVASGLWPELEALRDDMRPYKALGANDLSEDAYDVLRQQAMRRVHLAAGGVALAEHLTVAQLSALYRPFEDLVPLSGVLRDAPDFERDLALAFLVSSRLAAEQSPGSTVDKVRMWKTVTPRWLWLFNGGENPGISVPSMQISMALMSAISAFMQDGGGKAMRYRGLTLAHEAERRASGSAGEIKAHLGAFRQWQIPRHTRRWLVRCISRVMEAILWGELPDGTKTAQPSEESLAVIAQALEAMGFLPSDVEPPAPEGGFLPVPPSLAWWKPLRIDLGVSLVASSAAGGVASHETTVSPPDAQRRNTELVADPEHFESALDWYRTTVLPFIDDYQRAPTGTQFPDIGLSRFSAAISYSTQPSEIRLLLWALADAMLVYAEARAEDHVAASEMQLLRLPLIRAIWWEEVHAATRSVLGLRPEDAEPELGDPRFLDYFNKFSEARDRVEQAMLRFLKISSREDQVPSDDQSALQVAMAARAAIPMASHAQATRAGCGASVLLCCALAVAAVVHAGLLGFGVL